MRREFYDRLARPFEQDEKKKRRLLLVNNVIHCISGSSGCAGSTEGSASASDSSDSVPFFCRGYFIPEAVQCEASL